MATRTHHINGKKIEVLDESGFGHTLGFGLELSPEERQELITVLINLGKKED
jgi:hypothetical protein